MTDFSKFHQGWFHKPREVARIQEGLKYPVACDAITSLKGTGKGKTVLLYRHAQELAGEFIVRRQAIGDCVSFGAATAVDVTLASDIIIDGDWEEWRGWTSTEDIYGGSRVIIGGGQLWGDGSVGIWAAKYVRDYGTLLRQKYGNYDLSVYSGSRAKEWGRRGVGVPQELLGYAKQHKIESITQVRTWEEARDLLANGYGITIASNRGFSNVRDKDGFAAPSGSWAHQMALIGMKDDRRPGVLIMNSWGKWNSGPKLFDDQPDGSFWCDADVLERDILSRDDSWAFSGIDGYQPKNFNLYSLA